MSNKKIKKKLKKKTRHVGLSDPACLRIFLKKA